MADERTSGVWLKREEFEKRGFVANLDRIQAEHLSFGGVADAVIRQSGVSVLLVSSGDGHRPPDKES